MKLFAFRSAPDTGLAGTVWCVRTLRSPPRESSPPRHRLVREAPEVEIAERILAGDGPVLQAVRGLRGTCLREVCVTVQRGLHVHGSRV